MKRLFYILTILFLSSCGTTTKIPADVKWDITKEESNEALNSSNINISLNKKVEESTLESIALELRKTRTQYDKLWIFYYIPDISDNKVWATTYFNPDLSVDILGSTVPKDEANPKLIDVEGEIIGKWRSEKSLPGAILSLVKDSEGQLHVLISMTGEIKLDSKVKKTTVDGNDKYMDPKSHGEYYVLESNGNLGMYNNNGKFDEAVIIK